MSFVLFRFILQFVQCRTGMSLTQVRFPGAARDFSPGVNFQCRLSYCVSTPLCAITCINICVHVRDPVIHIGLVNYGNTRTPSMRCRLCSAPLSQLAFPGEGNPKCPWEKFHWDNTAVEKNVHMKPE